MTSITNTTPQDRIGLAVPKFGLTQRSRANISVLGSIQKCSFGLARRAAAENFAADPEGPRLIDERVSNSSAEPMRARVARGKRVAEADLVYRLERFMQRYVGEEIFSRAIPAVEERRQQFETFKVLGNEIAGGSLELNPDVAMPKYYTESEWHLEPGGWDGYDLYGAVLAHVIAPGVFRDGGYAAAPFGEDNTHHRVEILKQLPRDRYERIYEPGCGGVTGASAISVVYPEAEIVGSDLSPLVLKIGHLVAERRGVKMALKQRDLLHTGEPDESFDAIVNFKRIHELPPDVEVELFKEMLRILRPGGNMVLADPPPFCAVDPFHDVILDWDAKNREELFLSTTRLSNRDEELERIGFVDVKSFGLGAADYPWVTLATKPV